MLNAIFQFFKLFKHLHVVDLVKLQRISTLHTFSKGQRIASVDERYPYIIAIRSGIIRTYEVSSSGEERTTRLASEGDFSSCTASFLENKVSTEYMEAVEECKVILIDIREFQKLTANYPRFMSLYSEGLADAFLEAADRVRFFTLLTPEERYIKMLEESPKLVQRVPQKYLASYIGVTTVSLSRIRKRVSEVKS